MTKWKKTATKQLLKHPRLDVFEDYIELPNGKKTTYLHFGKAKNSVTTIVIRDDRKILLQKEFSYPSGEWLFQFPGGGLKKDEDPIEGIKRELSEEANLTGDFEEIGWFYTDNRRKKDRMSVFITTNIMASIGTKDQEEDFIDFWLSESEINQMIATNSIVNYSTLASWSIYNSHYRSSLIQKQ